MLRRVTAPNTSQRLNMPRKKKLGFTQFKLRISDELRRALEKVAAARGVSLNHEAVERLEASLRADDLKSVIRQTIIELQGPDAPRNWPPNVDPYRKKENPDE